MMPEGSGRHQGDAREPGSDFTPLASEPIMVTVAIASYNCEAYLEQAVASVLLQEVDLEIIIVDDASTDATACIAARLARNDKRIQYIRLASNAGPAGARNAALEIARGRWFAILDADDMMHPDRLKALVTMAEAENADLIADDLIVFDEDNRKPPERFLKNHTPGTSHWITLADYLRSTKMSDSKANMGYLKPIIRVARLRHAKIKYDERLRIGEDDQFIFTLLLAEFRYRLTVTAGYYYRKHSNSISHRLSIDTMDKISLVMHQMRSGMRARSYDERAAFDARARSVSRTAAFVTALEHVKSNNWWRACCVFGASPGAILLLRQPPIDRARRLIAQLTYRPANGMHVIVVASKGSETLARSMASHLQAEHIDTILVTIGTRATSHITGPDAQAGYREMSLADDYFQRNAGGPAIADARLMLLQIARPAHTVIAAGNVPNRLLRELAINMLDMLHLDQCSDLDLVRRTVLENSAREQTAPIVKAI